MLGGSCHCGAVTFSVLEEPEQATHCNCTLCRRWGALWAYGFRDDDIRVEGPTQAYMWGSQSIAFHFCQNCGCLAYWITPEAGRDGRYYLAVNLRLADPEEVASIPIKRFDGLDTFKALPKDGRCIGDVVSV